MTSRPRYGKQKFNDNPSTKTNASLHRLLLTFGLFLVVFGSLILTIRPISDSDFWHHIAFGRVLLEQGHFPITDTLGSTTQDRFWVSSGWLPSVLLYEAYKLSPEAGPYMVVWGVVLLMALVLFVYGLRRTGSIMLAATVSIAALGASAPRFLPRPDVFSQAFMPVLLILLVWYEKQPLSRNTTGWLRAAALPLLFCAWANFHMLFVVGFAVACLFMAWALWEWRQGRRNDGFALMITWVASALACLATPYGWRAFWFIAENANLHHASSRINELKPLWTAIGEGGAGASFFCLAVWLLLCAWLMLAKQFRDTTAPKALWQWAAVAFLLILALVQRRQIALAVPGISIMVFAGLRYGQTAQGLASRLQFLAPLVMLIVMKVTLTSGGFLPTFSELAGKRGRMGVDCNWLPCEAIGFLKTNPPPANLFHDLYTGSFLAYQLTPTTKVLIDGRLEAYNNGVYDDFFGPTEGAFPIENLFEKYQIRSALIDWRDAGIQPGLAGDLSTQPNWHLCWFSDHYALFVQGKAGLDKTGQNKAGQDKGGQNKADQDQADPGTDSYLSKTAYQFLNPLFPEKFMTALNDPAVAGQAKAEARRAAQEAPGSTLTQKALQVSGQL